MPQGPATPTGDYFSPKDHPQPDGGKRMSNRNSTVIKYAREYDDVFVTDGPSALYCKVCEVKVMADKPQSVLQHLKTVKHLKHAGVLATSAGESRRHSVSKSFVASTSVQETCLHGSSADDVRAAAAVQDAMSASASAAVALPAASAGKKSQFCKDLCRALMYADVPLSKVAVPEFRSFVEKYALHAVPAEGELRKAYADDCYRDAVARVRQRLAGHKIWASLDETVDAADGALIGTVVVGALSPDGPGDAYLLAAGVLRDGDGDDAPTGGLAAARLFDDAMGLLWPDGVRHGDVFLLLSAASPRASRAAHRLAAVYAKMVPAACVARELHAVAEHICADYPAVDSLVAHANRAFSRDPTRFARLRARAPGVPPPPEPRVPARWCTWLEAARYLSENFAAVRDVLTDGPDDPGPVRLARRLAVEPTTEPNLALVDSNYGFLPARIAQLEARGAPLTRAVAAVLETADRLAEVDGHLGAAVHRRFADALRKNDGFQVLVKITDIMAGRSETMDGLPSHLSGNDIKYFKYAPVAAVDVRVTYPRCEVIFSRENRIAYDEQSLNKLLVVQCNNFSATRPP